ncbi:MAG: S8 family serine peptidase [Salibacteraceae bacterium]
MKAIIFIFFIFGSWLSGNSQNSYTKNQVIILMNEHNDPSPVIEKINLLNNSLNLEITKTLSARAGIFLLEFNDSKFSVPEVLDVIGEFKQIAISQPNHNNIKSRATLPNDLEYPVQWSVGSNAKARIFAPEAWDISTDGVTLTGDTIVVAVVDGGMDLNHIDLNLYKNKHEIPSNGIDDDNNGYVDDYDGWSAYTSSGVIGNDDHGTHIAGTIGANTNNSEGVAGIMWGGKVVPINASSSQESVVIEGYGYALELRSKYNETNGDSGAFIVATNSSFGIDYGDPADYPIWCAFYDTLGNAGILNMGATSNSGLNVDVTGDIPTTCPSNFMISVSNINQNGNVIGGYGETQIDLAAPGTDIRSTMPNHGYGFKTGTSMATPHVAGVVGAMYSAMCGFDVEAALQKPDSLALVMRQKLLESVDVDSNLSDKNATSGRLNMFTALKSVQPGVIDITYDRTPASNSTSSDGSIAIFPQGGTNPYSYIWNNGETTSSITNLSAGQYVVTVTEKYGCLSNESIDLWTVAINEIASNNELTVYPNPSNGIFSLRINTLPVNNQLVVIYNVLGKVVYTTEWETNHSYLEIQTELISGVYFVKVGDLEKVRVIIN